MGRVGGPGAGLSRTGGPGATVGRTGGPGGQHYNIKTIYGAEKGMKAKAC